MKLNDEIIDTLATLYGSRIVARAINAGAETIDEVEYFIEHGEIPLPEIPECPENSRLAESATITPRGEKAGWKFTHQGVIIAPNGNTGIDVVREGLNNHYLRPCYRIFSNI